MLIFLVLLLGAFNICCSVAAGAIPIPFPPSSADGLGFLLEGQGPETVWDANSQPIAADFTATYVTLRRASLRNVLLAAPTPTVPLALVTNGSFAGNWYLEDLLIHVPSCTSLILFAKMACDLQPAPWISSRGWSVTISSFTGGKFTSSNVTITCDYSSSSPDSSSLSTPTTALPSAPSCVTLTAASPNDLLSILTYNDPSGKLSLPPSPSRLHITLTANVSLDPRVWAAAYPVLTRPLTTISGTDCRRVTAMNLNGAISIMAVQGGAILRFLCLEIYNLATDTLGSSMPRSLLSGAVWAVDVDVSNRSRLLLENSSLVLTKDEFKWQSYFMAQALSNSAVYGNVTTVLPSFQGVVSPFQLVWLNVSSPHTLWRNVILTSLPRVYDTTVPNSFIMTYLGLSVYLTDLQMVYTCNDLLTAVRKVPSGDSPWVLVLGANISLAPCWPTGSPVPITGPALMLMGLPDVTTTLDLAGRTDAFEMEAGTTLSIRFLTLLGLNVHEDASEVDLNSPTLTAAPTALVTTTTTTTTSSTAASTTTGENPRSALSKATALLWAFHFVRRTVMLELESVSIVVPAMELQQYDSIIKDRQASAPYFSDLVVYIEASSVSAVQRPISVQSNSSSTNGSDIILNGAAPRVIASLTFDSLLLPGIRGSDVSISVWSGIYGNWSASMYDIGNSGDGNGGGTTADGGERGSRIKAWQIVLVAVGASIMVAIVVFASVLYGIRTRFLGMIGATTKRRADVERGEGGMAPANGQPLVRSNGGAGSEMAAVQLRRPLYDSFDDPVFELDLVRGNKLSPDDIADVLERVNAEAAEFNLHMTEICGSGAFGVVYGGMWHGLKVAIKTMVFSESAPPHANGEVARERCIREAAFCCTMHHPNVVATHHFYLKSTKRHTMFDDVLQQMGDSSSDDVDVRRRRPHPVPLPAPRKCLAAPTPPAEDDAVARACGNGRQQDKVPAAVAVAVAVADGDGDGNPSGGGGAAAAAITTTTGAAAPAAITTPTATPTTTGAAAAASALPGRRIALRKGMMASLPRLRLKKNNAPVTDWRLYLIQEFCDGGTLRQAVDGGKIFGHSGMKRTGRCGGGGGAAAAANGNNPYAGSERRSDSVEYMQTFVMIGKQGVVASGNGEKANAAVTAPLTNEAGGGGGSVAAAAAAAAAPPAIGLLDDELLLAPQDPGTRAAEAKISTLTAQSDVVQGLRRPLTSCMESTVIDTTTTNATVDSTIVPTVVDSSDGGESVTLPAPPSPSRPAATAAVQPPLPPPPPLAVAGPPEVVLPADLFLVVHTGLGIASGVAYLHSRNIIHGDLSSNNVLLMKTCMEDVPVLAKLSDFGLSMRLEQGQEQLKNVHHGTPYYQSPEVVEHGTLSLAADVYSLGVLLWELYHGTPPWRAKRHKARKQPQRAQGPVVAAAVAAAAAADGSLWDDAHHRLRACDVLAISPTCPEHYARVLRRCLSADPRARPSARVVVKALLRMERTLAAAAAAAGDKMSMTGAPVGAMMALTRPIKPTLGRVHDAALLLEDFDAAAAAVAEAVARVTAAPTVAGAPATAGAAAAVAAAAAAGAVSGSLLPVLDSSPQVMTAVVAARAAGAWQKDHGGGGTAAAKVSTESSQPVAAATVTTTATSRTTATATATGTASASAAAMDETERHVETLE